MPCAFKPCPLEINSNSRWKGRHMESCSLTTKNITSPLPQCPWPPNLQGGDLPWQAPVHKIKWPFHYAVLWDHVTNSTTRLVMPTKLYIMVICFDGLLPIKSYDPLINWSCKITWQTKTIISPHHITYGHQTL